MYTFIIYLYFCAIYLFAVVGFTLFFFKFHRSIPIDQQHIHEWKRQSQKNSSNSQTPYKAKLLWHLSTCPQKKIQFGKIKKFSENKNFAFVLSRKMPLKQKREKYSRSLLLTQREFCTFAVFLGIC